MKIVHFDDDPFVTCITTAVIDASVGDCAASEFYLDSRELKRSARDRGITDMTVKHINDHSLYFFNTRNLGVPVFALREARSKLIWEKDKNGRILMYYSDTGDCDKTHPIKPNTVVISAHNVWSLEPLPPIGDIPQTKVVFTCRMD